MIDVEYLRLLRGLVLLVMLGMVVLFAFLAALWQERKNRRLTAFARAEAQPAQPVATADGDRRIAERQPVRRDGRPAAGATKRAA